MIRQDLLLIKMKRIEILINSKMNLCKVCKNHKEKKKILDEISLLIFDYRTYKLQL